MRLARLALLLLLTACSDDDARPDAAPAPLDAALPDAPVAVADAALPDAGSLCPRLPAPADRARKVVVSHPYDSGGAQAGVYEVLDLAADGTLTRPGVTFSMGRSTYGEIVFTPDGEVGLVATEDGAVAVFRFDAGGAPIVVHEGFADDSFYAARVVMDPSGERAYVVDSQWAEYGGGVHSVAIGCDGSLTLEGQRVSAKLAYAFALLGDGRAAMVGLELPGAAAGDDVNLLSWGEEPARLASVDAWGDDAAIVADGQLTADGAYFLLADNSAFSGSGGRLAAVEITEGGLRAAQVLDIADSAADPAVLVPSPFADAALVLGCMDDAILAVSYDPASAAAPLTLTGKLALGGVQLPCAAAMVVRGGLTGRVLIAENTAVRQLAFAAGGAIEQVGLLSLGSGYPSITGAIGLQP
jgi:hypothetical protein